jgi:hypothetical protein
MAASNDGWEVVSDPGEIQRAQQFLAGSKGGGKGKPKLPAVPRSGDMLELSKGRDDARKAQALNSRVRAQLDQVQGLYNRHLKGSGPIKSLREYLPSQGNAQMDRAFGQLQTLVRPATRTPGEGAMSDYESKLAMQATPSRYAFDASNEEAMNGLRRFLDSNDAAFARQLGQQLPTPPPRPRKAPSQSITIDAEGNIVR